MRSNKLKYSQMSSSGKAGDVDLSARREFTEKRMIDLKERLCDSESRYGVRASVYATGSFGRGEAGADSDLDLFITAKQEEGASDKPLSRLSEIVLKANLIQAIDDLKLPEFDGDGEYLRCYTNFELVKNLGKPDDDAINTFTARLLLLMESKRLIGEEIYSEVIDDVIAAYWRDYQDHKNEFSPSFLVNDILRLWRTFCVNYEARTKTSPREEKNKRRVKNYKLKHSRMLTCYSAILNLLSVHGSQGTVHPDDFKAIVGRTPTERLEWILNVEEGARTREHVSDLLTAYDRFMQRTSVGSERLANEFDDRDTHIRYMSEANEFGKKIHYALFSVGGETEFYRHIVV